MKTKCVISAPQLSNAKIEVELGTTIIELLDMFEQNDKRYIGVIVNNKYSGFDSPLYQQSIIQFLTLDSQEGEKIYRRTITMILDKAVRNLFPESDLMINYAVPRGSDFEIKNSDNVIDYAEYLTIEMRRIINADLHIESNIIHADKAELLFEKNGWLDKVETMKNKRSLYYTLNTCGKYSGFFYGELAYSTGYINQFEIIKFRNRYVLYHPYDNIVERKENFNHSIRYYDTVNHFNRMMLNLDCKLMNDINSKVSGSHKHDMIKVAETIQTRQLVDVAERFNEKHSYGAKLILISGPSSSGKTTFSHKFRIMLKTFGINPHVLSMDDYFINREEYAVDENGEKDFEHFENVDINLFNTHLAALLEGDEIEVPKYDFVSGLRSFNSGHKLKLSGNDVVVIEGIHALNPRLVENITESSLFKIYLAPLISMSFDRVNAFSVDDYRLIRRIVRDSYFRGYPAVDTLKRWASVRRGEVNNVFPFQNNADYFFGTSLFYELNVLKPHIVKLLSEVPDYETSYAEADRLLMMINEITPLDTNLVPSDSLIREFVGGSSFEV